MVIVDTIEQETHSAHDLMRVCRACLHKCVSSRKKDSLEVKAYSPYSMLYLTSIKIYKLLV